MSTGTKKLPDVVLALIAALDLSVDRVLVKLRERQGHLGVAELPVSEVIRIIEGLAPASELVRAKLIMQVAPDLVKLVRTGKSRVEPDESALA